MPTIVATREVLMIDPNFRRKNFNDETLQTATMHKLLWDSEDIEYLEKHLQDPTEEIAIELGRTYQAIQDKRYDLRMMKEGNMAKKKQNTEPEEEFLTFNEAYKKREGLLKQGMQYPTIMSRGNGKYQVIEGRAA